MVAILSPPQCVYHFAIYTKWVGWCKKDLTPLQMHLAIHRQYITAVNRVMCCQYDEVWFIFLFLKGRSILPRSERLYDPVCQ